jgi:hypothetical protein
MPVRSWFLMLAALVTVMGGMELAGVTPALSADEVPAQNTPVAPFIPYAAGLSLGAHETASKNADPSLTTLAPAPTNSGGLDEVEIAPRKTLMLSSQSTWEKGFDNLAAAFKQLDEIVMAAGFDVVGRPFAVFTETDDSGFRFDAMLPVSIDEAGANADEALQQAAAEFATGSEAKQPLPAVRLGESPSGKAFRFVHASPYDDIDTAYEAITTYLDGKNVVVQDTFIEEYVTDLTNPTDEALEVYIYVRPKEQSQEAPKAIAPAEAQSASEFTVPDAAKEIAPETKQQEGVQAQETRPPELPSSAAPAIEPVAPPENAPDKAIN